jgi:hypothetical protein
MVERHQLGRLVGFQDVDGVTTALLELLEEESGTRQARFEEARAALTWEHAAEPLVAFCRNPQRAADRQDPCRGYDDTLATADTVKQLQTQVEHQADELERLRGLVAGYERGKFMRLMRKYGRMRSRLTGRGR